MPLITTPNLTDPDAFYAALLRAHDGLSAEEMQSLNARLVLLLANHIGDNGVLTEALAAASLQADKTTIDDPTKA